MPIFKLVAVVSLAGLLAACTGMGGPAGGVQDDEKSAPGGETTESNTPG